MLHIYKCEVCGAMAVLEPAEAYQEGWDYPPITGRYGELSPRTCPHCAVQDTVWWKLVVAGASEDDLNVLQRAALARMRDEPASMLPNRQRR